MAGQAKFSRRVARVVFAVMVLGIVAHLVTVGAVFHQSDLLIREWILTIGLRLTRIPAEAGILSDERLRAEFGDLPGFVLVLYDGNGRAVARSRSDVPILEQLPERVLRTASPDRAVFPGPSIIGTEHIAILRLREQPGAPGYVGLFDRWAAYHVLFGVGLALCSGFIASVLVWVLATVVLGRRLRKGLHHAEKVVHRIADGDLAIRLPSYGEDEVGRLAVDFNRMADKLAQHIDDLRRERDLRRRSFADWTHEIATPLTSVLGYLESLCMEDLDPSAQDRYLATAYERALALKALTDDLRTMSELDFDGLHMETHPLDLAAIARIEVEGFVHEAETRGVALRSEQDDESAFAVGDGQRLAQVVRNLVSNALRHSPKGGEVVVSVQGTRLEVRDEGSGIPAEHIAHLGELFYRADRSRDRKTGGRGLGLAIAKGIVEAHGGKLVISSEVGVGTIVKVELLPHLDNFVPSP